MVIEAYNYNTYCLINKLKLDLSAKIFTSGELFNYILLFLNKYENNEEIFINSIKILRALLINSN